MHARRGLSTRLDWMNTLQSKTLEQLVEGSSEPIIVAEIDRPDWPVVLCNPAFDAISGAYSALQRPFADVVEHLVGRDLALDISKTVRSGQENSVPVEVGGRDYLLVLRPLRQGEEKGTRLYAAYWRGGVGPVGGAANGEMHQALLNAKRRIRDLSRDDPVTGLLNDSAFREILAHDWAVAARENNTLALVSFSLDDFDAYLDVFGKHATDSCMRRIAQAIRRSLRRASDVAARLDNDKLIVLSHAAEEAGVRDFAVQISTAIRALGLHHPRSSVSRFVTVSFKVCMKRAGKGAGSAEKFLGTVLTD